MNAEIITIGTELLLGDILDTNARTIARRLREAGIDLYRTTTVGDNPGRIADAMREALGRSTVVITTGGLGPTVDDPTREAAAAAVGVATVFHENLWTEIQERFARFGRTPTENNRRQAYLPAGAAALHNPVGTAPGFQVDHGTSVLIALPGVPAEMEWLLEHEVMPYLTNRLGPTVGLHTRTLRLAGVGESSVDERIQDLESLASPTVGVLAHPGRIDLRIVAKAETRAAGLAAIAPVEAEIRRRLAADIIGADSDSLEGVVLAALAARDWRLVTVEAGTAGHLASAMAPHGQGWVGGIVLRDGEDTTQDDRTERWMREFGAEACLCIGLNESRRSAAITVTFRAPQVREDWPRKYGGPLMNAPAWAVSIALDLVRRRLSQD